MPTLYTHIDQNKRKTWLLIGLYIVFVVGIVWLITEIYGYGPELIIFAVIFSVIMSLVSYYAGDKAALAASGAKPVTKEGNAYVMRMVENLSITAGIPKPKVYIIDDPAINAFATGRDPEHASIAVTTGAIEKLENEELEGVLAHEMSHVKNYDIRVLTIVVLLVGVITLIADLSLRGMLFGGRRNNREGGGILAIIGIVLIVLSPIIAKLIQLAVSRKREFLADASAALLTRFPEGLANALEKIKNENKKMQKASNATAHLFISNPFSAKKMSKLFSTHPPIDERIKRLRNT